MIESLDKFIGRQKNIITMILLLTLMCWFIPYAKYIAVILIPVYAVLFNKAKNILMEDIEIHFLKNHTEEYKLYKDKSKGTSILGIRVSPFIDSDYFVQTMFDRVFVEKCEEANRVNIIVVIMIIGLAGTVLLIS